VITVVIEEAGEVVVAKTYVKNGIPNASGRRVNTHLKRHELRFSNIAAQIAIYGEMRCLIFGNAYGYRCTKNEDSGWQSCYFALRVSRNIQKCDVYAARQHIFRKRVTFWLRESKSFVAFATRQHNYRRKVGSSI